MTKLQRFNYYAVIICFFILTALYIVQHVTLQNTLALVTLYDYMANEIKAYDCPENFSVESGKYTISMETNESVQTFSISWKDFLIIKRTQKHTETTPNQCL